MNLSTSKSAPFIFDAHLHRAIEANFDMPCEQEVLAQLYQVCFVLLRQGIYFEIGDEQQSKVRNIVIDW